MNHNQQTKNRIFRNQIFDIPEIDNSTDDLIFPFEVKTGFVNSTEQGFVFNNDVRNYGRFERIFTGFEAVSAIWQESTATIVDKTNPNAKKLLKDYRPGLAFTAWFDSEDIQNDFSQLNEDADFTREQVIQTVTYYTKTKINPSDEFKFYLMPKRMGSTIFFIDDVKEYYDPNDKDVLVYTQLTLKSLNDRLANTGLAIDQYVQFSAPGEGYAFPRVVPTYDTYLRREYENAGNYFDDTSLIPVDKLVDKAMFMILNFNNYGETVVQYDATSTEFSILKNLNGYVLDEEKLMNRPVARAQIEVYGPGILSSMYAHGRPITNAKNSNKEIIQKPRLLLLNDVKGPNITQRDITKPLSQNTSWYWVARSRLEVETFYKDWTEKVKGNWNPAITKEWLGYLRVVAQDYKVAAKPAIGWRIFSDIFSLGIAEAIYAPDRQVKIPPSGFWELKGVQTLPKMLSAGYFIHRSVPRLPLNYKESIPWTFKNIPLVGGFLSKLTLGLPIGWKNQVDLGGKNYNVSGMISEAYLDFYKDTFIGIKTERITPDLLGANKQDYTAIPLDGLSNKAEPSIISPGEFATILNYGFTDRFYSDTEDTNVYGNEADSTKAPTQPTQDLSIPSTSVLQNTVDLGIDDGNGDPKAEYKVNSMPGPKADPNAGYAIDSFGFHFLGSADYKVSFFDINDEVVFTGTYKTLSKLTGSTRDWNNNLKLSHWESEENVDDVTELPTPALKLPTDTTSFENHMPNGILLPDYQLITDPTDPTKTIIGRDVYGNPLTKLDTNGVELVKTVASLSEVATSRPVHTYVPPVAATEKVVVSNGRITTPAFFGYWIGSFNQSELATLYNEGYRTVKLRFNYNIKWREFAVGSKGKVLVDAGDNPDDLVGVDLKADGSFGYTKTGNQQHKIVFTSGSNEATFTYGDGVTSDNILTPTGNVPDIKVSITYATFYK